MTSQLDLTTAYRLSPEAVESRLGDETVILHLGNSTYFGLDAVGTIVWERLGRGPDTPAALCAHVRKIFADVPDPVEADVTAFLTQLAEHGLIQKA